jgi:hypothetical protein
MLGERRTSRLPVRSFINDFIQRRKTKKENKKEKTMMAAPPTSTRHAPNRPVPRAPVGTPRRMAPLPRAPAPSPLERHNDLVAQAGTVRRRARDLANVMPSNEQKLDLLQSLEVSYMIIRITLGSLTVNSI